MSLRLSVCMSVFCFMEVSRVFHGFLKGFYPALEWINKFPFIIKSVLSLGQVSPVIISFIVNTAKHYHNITRDKTILSNNIDYSYFTNKVIV